MSSSASPAESFSDNASTTESSSTASVIISDDASELRGLDNMDF
jgi:hypothetical protein